MQHVLYLKSHTPVCENPDKLGKDFVLFDYEAEGFECETCMSLCSFRDDRPLSEEIYDMNTHDLKTVEFHYHNDVATSGPAIQGLMVGLLISSVFWIVLFFVLGATF